MKTEVTPRLLDIVMQTGQARLQTDTLLQDIVYILEATCELIRLKQLLQELRFGNYGQMTPVCDNQASCTLLPTQSFMR